MSYCRQNGQTNKKSSSCSPRLFHTDTYRVLQQFVETLSPQGLFLEGNVLGELTDLTVQVKHRTGHIDLFALFFPRRVTSDVR